MMPRMGAEFERLAEISAEELLEIVAVLREELRIEIQVAELGDFAGRQRVSAEELDCEDFAARTDCASSGAGGVPSAARSPAGGRAR